MDNKELNTNIYEFAYDNNVSIDEVEVIYKKDLEIGKTYNGTCRNSSIAIWKGDYFEYERYKFGSTYIDKINHFEDDDGYYDVFVPMKIKN